MDQDLHDPSQTPTILAIVLDMFYIVLITVVDSTINEDS